MPRYGIYDSTELTRQADYCAAMLMRMRSRIENHEAIRLSSEDEWDRRRHDGQKTGDGHTKSELQRQISVLRHELNELSRMLDTEPSEY